MPEKSHAVSEVLDLAADLMDEHGWQVGEYFDVPMSDILTPKGEYVGGTMCTEGAIRAASSLIWSDELRRDVRNMGARRLECHAAFAAVAELIPEDQAIPPGARLHSIPWWNDTHCTSKDEAIALLRDAATKTRPDA